MLNKIFSKTIFVVLLIVTGLGVGVLAQTVRSGSRSRA